MSQQPQPPETGRLRASAEFIAEHKALRAALSRVGAFLTDLAQNPPSALPVYLGDWHQRPNSYEYITEYVTGQKREKVEIRVGLEINSDKPFLYLNTGKGYGYIVNIDAENNLHLYHKQLGSEELSLELDPAQYSPLIQTALTLTETLASELKQYLERAHSKHFTDFQLLTRYLSQVVLYPDQEGWQIGHWNERSHDFPEIWKFIHSVSSEKDYYSIWLQPSGRILIAKKIPYKERPAIIEGYEIIPDNESYRIVTYNPQSSESQLNGEQPHFPHKEIRYLVEEMISKGRALSQNDLTS